MPPQLEKNHVVPTSWQDEALARDGVSRDCLLYVQLTENKVPEAQRIERPHSGESRTVISVMLDGRDSYCGDWHDLSGTHPSTSWVSKGDHPIFLRVHF